MANGILIDLTGQTFTRLTVQRREGRHRWEATWLCLCSCGKSIVATGYALRSRNTKSCGCLRDELLSKRRLKHGRSRITREYRAWCAAKTRCDNPNQPRWKHYGGRGITMCAEWRESFEAFFRDMGPCPDGYSMDRINNDGHYEPGNCRWAPSEIQMNNRASNHRIEYNGESKTIAQWSRATGLSTHTIGARIRLGWPIERALTDPLHQ